MRLRVAPPPASSHPDRVSFPGCPFRAPFLLSWRPNPQVAPWFRSFGCAGDGCSSYPEPLIPSAVPVLARFRVSPVALASSCSAPDVGLGFPLVLHLRLYRRWIIESPRCSHLRRCRVANPRVAPSISLSVSPTIRRPSYPVRRILRHRLMDIRVTPDHAPTGSPWVESPGRPGYSSPATAIDQFPGCPKSWVSHRSPIHRVSSCPESWFLG
jgi:hypothetical protein